MWDVNYQLNQSKKVEFKLYVQDGEFLRYLENKVMTFPIYINSHYSWYCFYSPYRIELEAEPEGASTPLILNQRLVFEFPELSLKKLQHWAEQIQRSLSSWIRSEYVQFCRQWLLTVS